MPAVWKVAKLRNWRLCLFCYGHDAEHGCLARAEQGYKGCGVHGCKEHHHKNLHFALMAARLFSVHAQPAEVEPGAQIFSLRQNLRQGCNIAYDGGGDQTIVTEEYAKRKGLRRVGGTAAAIGLGQTEATTGEMYVLTLCDRWMKVHYLEAMAVPHIYTGPAAKSPKNLRKRFMKTYTP